VTNFAMLGVVPLCCVAWSLLTRDAEQLPRTVGRSSRGLDAECAASALLIAAQCQILKEETLSRAKKANQRSDAEFEMSKHDAQL